MAPCQPFVYPLAMPEKSPIARRFRGFLPVVVDIETGGFDSERDALLEIAASVIEMGDEGRLSPGAVISTHVAPFAGANVEAKSLELTGIDLDHPLRNALQEKAALKFICAPVRERMRSTGCNRAVLVGHNPAFDMAFLNAAIKRTGFKRSPFHPFSTFDTATLGGLAFGQTVLSRAVEAAGRQWCADDAHSAVYDVEMTAFLFCEIVNRWHQGLGIPWTRAAAAGDDSGGGQPGAG